MRVECRIIEQRAYNPVLRTPFHLFFDFFFDARRALRGTSTSRFADKDESSAMGKAELEFLQFGLIPAALTTFCHFGISRRIRAANSSGVLLTGSRPRFTNLLAVAGDFNS